MIPFQNYKQTLFQIDSNNFENTALEVFRYQAANNKVYHKYISNLNIEIDKVTSISKIPFLPISFFKNQVVKTQEWNAEATFRSSGTTGQVRSTHFVKEIQFYNTICKAVFNHFYGELSQYTIFALLPSYLERDDSSLVYMVNDFINSASEHSGFYLNDQKSMIDAIKEAQKLDKKILIIGVSFALLDIVDHYNINLSDVVVMETGGMKGRRKELVRSELHDILKKGFNVKQIHSEYGMTELLSQAYATEDGRFNTPPWMSVLLRDLNDPFDLNSKRKAGGINVIDLANIDSCCFIETQDLGSLNADGSFEVLGRIDNSEIRGCNLLISSF